MNHAFNIGVGHLASCLPINELICEQFWDSCPPSRYSSTHGRLLNATESAELWRQWQGVALGHD